MPIPLGILAVAGAGAGGGNSYDLLETTVLSTTASSVVFSNINTYTDYKHLELRMSVKTSRSDNADALLLRFNNDSGTKYAWQRLRSSSTTVNSARAENQTSIELGNIIGNATSNTFAPVITQILDFAAVKNKVTRTHVGSMSSVEHYAGLFLDTASITSITLLPGTGPNFVANSRFSLYGIKG